MVITGTNKGIGKYLAEYYLKKNFIIAGCSRSESTLEHKNYKHFYLDIADEEKVRKMVSSIYRKYDRIDYLINNAGIASMNHSLLTPALVVDKIFTTNFRGTFIFSREIGKIMMKNRFGRIINFSSVAVPLDLAGEAVYASSKAAVEKLTKIMAKEFGESNITVNALGPSPIETNLIKNVGTTRIENLLAKLSIPELGSFEDVSNICDFYLSDRSKKITGQVLYIGGV